MYDAFVTVLKKVIIKVMKVIKVKRLKNFIMWFISHMILQIENFIKKLLNIYIWYIFI